MNRHDCDICAGEGVVRLRTRPRLSVGTIGPASMDDTVQVSSKTFGCPQCSDQVPLTSLHVVSKDMVVRLPVELRAPAIEAAKHDIASAIGGAMLERGMIEFKERTSFERVMIGTIAIASPDRLPAIEQMVADRAIEAKRLLIEDTRRTVQLALGEIARRHLVTG